MAAKPSPQIAFSTPNIFKLEDIGWELRVFPILADGKIVVVCEKKLSAVDEARVQACFSEPVQFSHERSEFRDFRRNQLCNRLQQFYGDNTIVPGLDWAGYDFEPRPWWSDLVSITVLLIGLLLCTGVISVLGYVIYSLFFV